MNDPTCPGCGSPAITYSKAKLFDGKTSKCSSCGNTFDQEHAYAQPKAGRRIIAHFRPQAWVNDQAIDIDGEYSFDCTDLILSWELRRVLVLTDHSYEADEVWREHPVSTERPHTGPFEVEVEEAVRSYLTEIIQPRIAEEGQPGDSDSALPVS